MPLGLTNLSSFGSFPADGEVPVGSDAFATGKNADGQLSQGNRARLTSFTQMLGVSSVTQLAAGAEFSVVRTTEGKLFGVGKNAEGQLGLGDNDERLTFVQIGTEGDWTNVAAGEKFTVAIRGGMLFATGSNDSGQLGQGNLAPLNLLNQMGTATDWVSVAAGDRHVLAINNTGEMYSCGSDEDGQAGNGGGSSADVLTLTQVGIASNWDKVAAGNAHSLAINDSGELFVWGKGSDGQLGIVSSQEDSPIQVGALTTYTDIAGGDDFSAIIRSDDLFMTGINTTGQLGQGDTSPLTVFTQVGSDTWIEIACGKDHVLGIQTGGLLYTWGDNSLGQLGKGTSTGIEESPIQIGSLTWGDVDASASARFSLAIAA